MQKGAWLICLLSVATFAGCVIPSTAPSESVFKAPFRERIASVEIHRDDVRILHPGDPLADAIADEALTGLYRVEQWYKEVGARRPESSALLNASEYVMINFDGIQRFDFAFKEGDSALDALVILLVVGDVARADFIDHLVMCLDLHCQRLVSDDDARRRARVDAMTA